MIDREQDTARREYFAEHYEVIARYPLVTLRPHSLPLDNPSRRHCRFCGRDTSEAKFKNDAHAIPNLLGNKSLFSLNECDDCNSFLGKNYDDHLGKRTNLARALMQIPGKKNSKPTFKSADETLRIESVEAGMSIHVPAPHSVDELLANGVPKEIELTGDTSSQKYVPIRAAMALVKIACSVCPMEDLGQCQNAIDWLMSRWTFRFSKFPVLFGFTPGQSVTRRAR
jgi:HNH endonuclease